MHNKCKQIHASGLDKFRHRVNLALKYCVFDCVINSIFCIKHTHLEVSNSSLDARSKVEAIAAVIMLYLCESLHKSEVDVQSIELEFMIGGALALADEKIFDKKIVIKFNCRQRINLFKLANAVQSLLMLKKR